jgi:hypothetical protein
MTTNRCYISSERVLQQMSICVLVVSVTFIARTTHAGDEDVPVVVADAIGSSFVVVPVQLGTAQFSFVLDSGATHHAFDISLESYLGTRLRTAIANDTTSVSLFKMPTATICGIALGGASKPVASLDLAKFREAEGQDIRGIIGIPFFANRIIRLNTDRRELEVYPRTATVKHWGHEIPLSVDQRGLASVNASVAGQKFPMILVVDTGMTSEISLLPDVFDNLRDRKRVIVINSRISVGISGEARRATGRLEGFDLGPFTHRDLIVSRSIENRVGLDYLKRYSVTIDLTGRKMYLSESGQFNEIRQFDLSGLSLSMVDDRVVVKSIEAGSPGETAGISKGDVITACDGRSVNGGMLSEIRHILKNNVGREVLVTIRRGDEVKQISIRLREPPWRQQDK